MKNIYKIMALFAAIVASSTTANAAVIAWQPTNADVNYVYNTVAGYSLALFDVEDFDTLQASPLMLNTGTGADSISIDASGSDYSATSLVTGNNISLFGDNEFVLALTDGSDWFEPLSWFEIAPGSNIYSISFAYATVTAIDTAPAAVPVPAAAVLFGSGMLAVFGFARKRAVL